MIVPPTRGKKNATTLGKSSDQDWEAIEDSNPNEELSKFKEEVKGICVTYKKMYQIYKAC